ncbi:MAG: hypothetical protein AAF797_16935 [Planctomycetota bacterium]
MRLTQDRLTFVGVVVAMVVVAVAYIRLGQAIEPAATEAGMDAVPATANAGAVSGAALPGTPIRAGDEP